MSESAARTLARFAPMVYGPTALFALGSGAVIPLIPVVATGLGADLATAALVSSAMVIGQVTANIPTGILVARLGERLTMVFAGCLGLAASLGLLLANSLFTLAISVFVLGVSAAAFGVARHAFMTMRVPVAFRARALSLLGGSFRFGSFAGPFLAAGLLAVSGSEQTAIWALVICLAVAVGLVLFGPDPEIALAGQLPPSNPQSWTTGSIPVAGANGLIATVTRHRGVLLRLGSAAASMAMMRSTRTVLLPLWGVMIGLPSTDIVVVVGIAGAIDFALFYASGQLMDRFGRLVAALPAMALMSLSFIVLSFTGSLSSASGWFVAAAVTISLGNGLSSGILLTLGSDVAPRYEPATFLGAWRTITDTGAATAPLLISAIVAAVSLPIAAGAMGALGIVGMVGFMRWVPRYVQRK